MKLPKHVPFYGGVSVFYSFIVVFIVSILTSHISYAQSGGTFEDWKVDNFTVAEQADDLISGLLATPKGDGFPNLVKYALGLAVSELPTKSIPEIDRGSLTSGTMSVSFERPAGLSDVTYRIQYTSNLTNSASWADATLTAQTLTPGIELVTADDPVANAPQPRFTRLLVVHDSGVIAGPATNLQASAMSPTDVNLTWDGDLTTGGYLIEKSVEGGDFDIVGFVPAGVTSFLVKNLIPGEQVRFRASAVGTSVNMTPSNEDAVTPQLGTEGAVLLKFQNNDGPGAITISYNLIIENSTSEAIPLSELTIRYWMEYDNEGPLVSELYYSTTSSSGGANISDSITTTPIAAVNPINGADYMIDFTFAEGITLPAGTAANPGRFEMQGRMRKDYSGALTLAPGNDFSHLLQDEGLKVHNRINLLRNGQLIFGVEPGGGIGGVDRPVGPVALRALPLTESSIQLTWDDLATNETLFVIERDFIEEPDGFKILTTLSPNSAVFQDVGLLDQATYRYRVRAVNANGVSSSTNIANATTLDGVSPQFIPLQPENLLVSTFSDGRLDLQWTDASRNEKGFIIERQEGLGDFVEIARVNPGETSFIDFGLDAATNYTYRVTAFNLAGSAAATDSAGTTLTTQTPGPLTDAQVIRFLRQATFGATPNAALIQEVKALGFDAWLDAQFALPATLHTPSPLPGAWSQDERIEKWWDVVLTAPDQVRQRLAFALSQIFVVSQNDADLADQALGLANFYDILVNAADSTFREVLEEVTFSPVMGKYLDHTRNQKANGNVRPDENYAREIMQLFSIGLLQLNLDGTPKLDEDGIPIPTYNQRDIEQVARVFTGLTFAPAGDFFLNDTDFINPMRMDGAFHETGSKDFVLLNSNGSGGTAIPDITSGGDPLQDLELMHDGLANHPSCAPFICNLLIQRTVTSNPSPAYIERVSQVFVNTGGDFKAVFKAVLLDYEARSADPLDSTTYGKQREPVIRVANLYRMLGAQAGVDGFGIGDLTDRVLQAPLVAGSVFNFFEFGFSLPGPITLAGLVSPEFQTTQSSQIIRSANLYDAIIFGGFSSAVLDFSRYTTIAGNVDALLDQLSIDLLDGNMSAQNTGDPVGGKLSAMRMVISNYLTNITDPEMRAKAALYLVVTSSEFNIEQ